MFAPSLGARYSLPLHGLVSESAGEIWYATSVMSGLMLFGLAVFLFFFGLLPYWFKLHKHLHEILGCESRNLRGRLYRIEWD